MSSQTNKFYYIGLSLASNSGHSSSICVVDNSRRIVLLDKLYFTDDIKLFFDKSVYIKNGVVMVGLLPDETLLDGKWRIHSKNYKSLENKFEINRNNWTNRLNDRLKDFFLDLNKRTPVFRCNLNLLRQSYGLKADFLEKTSLDCKNFQAGLKIKYGFCDIPDNLLPSATLEAILYALFAYDINKNNIKTKQIAEFHGLKVLNKQ